MSKIVGRLSSAIDRGDIGDSEEEEEEDEEADYSEEEPEDCERPLQSGDGKQKVAAAPEVVTIDSDSADEAVPATNPKRRRPPSDLDSEDDEEEALPVLNKKRKRRRSAIDSDDG